MNSGNIALAYWSYGIAGLAFLAFACHLLRTGYWRVPGNSAGTALLAAVVGCSAWGWLNLAGLWAASAGLLTLATLLDAARYGCWYTFLLMLFWPAAGRAVPRSVAGLTGVAGLLVLLALTAHVLTFVDSALQHWATPWALFGSMALPLFGLVLVEQLFRNVPADSRWNAKPLCLGLAGMFLFDLYLYSEAVLFSRINADAFSIRGAVHALVIPLLLLSTTRRRDWLSRLRVSQRAAFHSATLLISGIYLLFISAIGYYVSFFGGEWGSALQLALIFLGVIVLLVIALSGAVRAKLRVFLGKHFFRYRYDYREEWLRFTQTLSTQTSPQELGQQVIRGLADMLESPAGGLWMKSGQQEVFRQTARWNFPACTEPEEPSAPLAEFLRQRGWVIDLQEYRAAPGHYAPLQVPEWLLAVPHAWLVVPLRVGVDLIAFVVLSSARTKTDVNWEVNDLLKTAGSQAASYLAQMSATEALLEVRKFDSFNRMSAFVVHDLKNIVTQLSLMMKNARRLHANPEFQQDMLMTVDNALERMRQLMLQLREGATPPGKPFGVELAPLVERIESVAAGRGRRLEVNLVERVVARGHEQRLERVIGHVVQNAFDATEPGGRVWLHLDRHGSQARIEVGDTGQGMSEEFIRDRLFKPFQTTKQAGMGIGAYESFQYVQELGGNISVQSEANKGTRVTLLLPLFEAHSQSDIHMTEAS